MVTDLQDWYAWVETILSRISTLDHGAFIGRAAIPNSGDCYLATDTGQLLVCYVTPTWVDVTAAYLLLAGGIMTGAIDMGANQINNMADPALAQDAATRAYVLAETAAYLLLAGGVMLGDINMAGEKVTGLGPPAAVNDALRYGVAEIRNNEIAAGAAIAYAKLNLALGIVNGDVAAAAAIAYSKLNLTGAIKKGDIEAAAGIEYSKLALAASIVMADFAAAIQNAANGIVVLDASADVPDAQIPNLAASKITSLRFPVDRLPAMTAEKIWKGTGANVEEVDMPIPMASGSYAGDNNDDRQITVGFACSGVLLKRLGTSYHWITLDTVDSLRIAATDKVDQRITLLLHATDGFVVDRISANEGGSTYNYVVFG